MTIIFPITSFAAAFTIRNYLKLFQSQAGKALMSERGQFCQKFGKNSTQRTGAQRGPRRALGAHILGWQPSVVSQSTAAQPAACALRVHTGGGPVRTDGAAPGCAGRMHGSDARGGRNERPRQRMRKATAAADRRHCDSGRMAFMNSPNILVN